MKKRYRCLECGFCLVADGSKPLEQINYENHADVLTGPSLDCPACTGYLKKYGGRKNGKIQMPDISVVGSLADETTVSDELAELNADWYELEKEDLTKDRKAALKAKYEGKKMFGYSVEDRLSLLEMLKAKKTQA